jgi:hypothetical protein
MKGIGVVVAGFAFAGAMPAQAAAPLARLQIVAVEFNYRLSRVRMPAGPVRIELAKLRPGRARPPTSVGRGLEGLPLPSSLPGERQTLNARLRPGLYRLKCTLADHAARGMHSKLRVVAPKPRRR